MTTIETMKADAYDTALAAAVDTVRAGHPNLDLRAGTAVRSLVLEPGALLDAMQRDEINRLKTAMSIRAMSREATVPREDAEAVLSNFGITLGGGTKATGFVRVNLISTASATIRAGAVFTDETSRRFIATKTVTASIDPAGDTEQIHSSGNGRYYFVVPVEAEEVGADGNIPQGHALSCSITLGNYYSSEAFSDFTGGEDGESVAAAVARIPAALAYRGMTNTLSVRAQLSSALGDPSLLRAVSCSGHRSRAQLRDKHNALGIAVGGRVDVYARLFDAPGVVSFIVDGTFDGTEKDEFDQDVYRYRIALPRYPGFYAVRYVGPADNESGRRGSLQHELLRGTVEGSSDEHDFDVSVDSCETAWSAYQDGELVARVYRDDNDTPTAGGPTMAFKVDLYWTDGISVLQAIVDSPEVRNVAADYVVRSPAICFVGMSAVVKPKSGMSLDSDALNDAVAAYVNGRSFVPRLTRSELANVLLQHGVESVDLSAGGMRLSGRLCGADGKWYFLEGDSLDVTAVGPERAMLTNETVVFAAEPGAIQVVVEE